MGDILANKERLLVVFIRDLPGALVDEIKAKFPQYELTVYRSEKGVPIPRGECKPQQYCHSFTNDVSRIMALGNDTGHVPRSA